jgi:hypothetical protein
LYFTGPDVLVYTAAAANNAADIYGNAVANNAVLVAWTRTANYFKIDWTVTFGTAGAANAATPTTTAIKLNKVSGTSYNVDLSGTGAALGTATATLYPATPTDAWGEAGDIMETADVTDTVTEGDLTASFSIDDASVATDVWFEITIDGCDTTGCWAAFLSNVATDVYDVFVIAYDSDWRMGMVKNVNGNNNADLSAATDKGDADVVGWHWGGDNLTVGFERVKAAATAAEDVSFADDAAVTGSWVVQNGASPVTVGDFSATGVTLVDATFTLAEPTTTTTTTTTTSDTTSDTTDDDDSASMIKVSLSLILASILAIFIQ